MKIFGRDVTTITFQNIARVHTAIAFLKYQIFTVAPQKDLRV